MLKGKVGLLQEGDAGAKSEEKRKKCRDLVSGQKANITKLDSLNSKLGSENSCSQYDILIFQAQILQGAGDILFAFFFLSIPFLFILVFHIPYILSLLPFPVVCTPSPFSLSH